MTRDTKLHRRIRLLFVATLAILTIVMLAGCGEQSDYGTGRDPDTSAETRVYKTDDGRRVTCLVLGRNLGDVPAAMSCDWIHADGSDYMGKDE